MMSRPKHLLECRNDLLTSPRLKHARPLQLAVLFPSTSHKSLTFAARAKHVFKQVFHFSTTAGCFNIPELIFPPSAGRKQDPEDAKNYICKLYEQQATNRDRREERKTLYPHFTCATDTSSIRRVFSDVKDTVLLKSLRDFGVI